MVRNPIQGGGDRRWKGLQQPGRCIREKLRPWPGATRMTANSGTSRPHIAGSDACLHAWCGLPPVRQNARRRGGVRCI